METILFVYVPCPSQDVAQKLARMALANALAGCINMWPVTSMYREDDEITADSEVIVLIKTVSSRIDALIDLLKQNHPYTTPCILTGNVLSNESYAAWLQEACK